MHFCLAMCSILSHWQLEGRAGVRPWPRHPGRGLLFMPFQANFVLTSKGKLSLFQVSGLPISTFRSWRDSCVTVYFFLFFSKKSYSFVVKRPDSWVTFWSCWCHLTWPYCSARQYNYLHFQSFMLQEAFCCPILSTPDILFEPLRAKKGCCS